MALVGGIAAAAGAFSGQFVVRQNGFAVRFMRAIGRSVFVLVADEDATRFSCRSLAWEQMRKHQMKGEICEI